MPRPRPRLFRHEDADTSELMRRRHAIYADILLA
jgi:hypothetical protein